MKKLNLLFTALLLMCYVGTAKAEKVTIDGIKYDVITDTKQATVISDGNYSGNIVIPSEITYNNVTCSVTSIGEGAFAYCFGLTSITIPNSVTSIEEDAFSGCSGLTSITIPNSVTSIGESAFAYCSGLTSITIPNSVTSIGNYAFISCSGLTSITIPNSVTSIGSSAFNGCEGLKEVHINDIAAWCNIDFGSYDANPLYYAQNLFLNNELITELVIPNGVTSIGGYAFYNCDGLTSITIPNSVTSIGSGAFNNCSRLTSITIPNSVTSIGGAAFYNCKGLTSITIPNSVTSIAYQAFYGCTGLTSITIPNSVTSIGSSAFRNCSGLKTVINFSNKTFSKGSSSNGYVAYYADNVINAPNGSIEGDFIFGKPNDVNTLLYYLGNTTELTLPADYKGENYAIGANVFNGNKTITSVEIPNSVTSIGENAFHYCEGLKEVHISDLSAWCNIDIGNDCANPLYYAHNLYLNGGIVTNLVIPDGVTEIKDHAFSGCSSLTSIAIPNSVTSIENGTFYGCSGLTSVTIPNSVTSIGSYAFEDCSALTSITIPNSVTSIGSYAFRDCSGLTSITIPNSVTSIGNDAFEYCSKLTSVTIGNSVTSIGNRAFYDCNNLKTVINFSNLTFSKGSSDYGYVAYYADKIINAQNASFEGDFVFNVIDGVNTLFLYLGNETEIILPNSYKDENYVIGEDVFANKTSITSIEIPNSVTSIGGSAFEGCNNLKTVINFSNLTFSKGASSNGYVAYYANKVYNANNGSIEGDYIFGKPNNVNTLVGYLGSETELTLPADYKGENYAIGANVFNGNKTITSVEIPNSVTSIGYSAFEGCTGLTSITIPNSVTSIGNSAFYNCSGLTSIVVDGNNTKYDSRENCNAIIETETNSLILGCNNTVIPNSVTSIGSSAFYGCTGLTSITIPNSVTSIESSAFYGCSGLKTVINFSNKTFSKGSSSNGYVAYYADEVYNVPNGSTEGDFIFGKPNDVNTLLYYLGNTTELTLPADYKGENYAIGANVFNGNKTITSVEIPNSVTSIGYSAFYDCSGLTSITIPNSVTSIGSSAFYGCTGLTAVHINDIVAWCGIDFGSADANPVHYAKNLYLNGELLTELSIPSEVTTIKDYAFYNCMGVTIIDIIDGIKGIENSAFYGCSDLETLYISNTIESIGDYAFAECNNILDIKIGSKKAIAASENIFSSDAYNNACLYVPEGRKFAYEKTTPWNNFYIVETNFTRIDEVKEQTVENNVIYDLQGLKVEKMTNTGIYIIDGKKTLIK